MVGTPPDITAFHRKRGQLLPHALRPLQAAADAERHVRADSQADLLQFIRRKSKPPQAIQPNERRRRVAAAAAHTRRYGNIFFERDAGAARAAVAA